MFKSIKFRMMFIYGLLIILIVGGLSWFAYNKSSDILRNNVYEEAANNVSLNAEIVSHDFAKIKDEILNLDVSWFEDNVENNLVNYMEAEQLKDMLLIKKEENFADIAERSEYFESIFVADINGDYKTGAGMEGSIAATASFKKMMESGELVLSQPFLNEESSSYQMSILRPLKAEDDIKVLIGAFIKLEYFNDLISNMNISDTGYGWIIDNSGIVISHTDSKYIGQNNIVNDGDESFKKVMNDIVSGKEGIADYKFKGIDKIMAYSPVSNTDWSLVLSAGTDKIMSELDAIKRASLISGIIAIIIGLIITYYIANSIAKPIVNLSNITKKIADGNLSLSKEEADVFNTKNEDEIAILASSVKQMLDGLKDIVTQISKLAESIANSSEALSISGEQVGETANQVSSSIQDVAAGAEEQSAQVDETINIIKGLINQIGETGDLSDKMKEKAEIVMSSINTGHKYVSDSVDKVNKIKADTTEVSSAIKTLGEISVEIGNIVDMINGISTQTNLLALNAAIEAARAGEAGRGFSVVSDEIRELAEESATATEKIAELINKIQAGITRAVSKMDDNEDIVDITVAKMDETGSVFNSVNNLADELNEMIRKVTDQAQKMEGNSKSAEDAINSVATVSNEAASNAEEVAASSEEQSAATEEIVSSAQQLSDISEELARTVNKFKL